MAEPRVMLKLGDYAFGIDTAAYRSLEHKLTMNWAELDRLGREGASQYTGRSLTTVRLAGSIATQMVEKGISQVSKMRSQALKAEPLLLVAGTGAVLGYWTVLEITETQGDFISIGLPEHVTFEVLLREYGKDTVTAGAVTTDALTEAGATRAADCATTVKAA